MLPTIDKLRTGQRLRLLIDKRGLTIRDVQEALGLGCVQSIYRWLDGQNMPTIDNLYALSELLRVPIDILVCGNRDPEKSLYFYYILVVSFYKKTKCLPLNKSF